MLTTTLAVLAVFAALNFALDRVGDFTDPVEYPR